MNIVHIATRMRHHSLHSGYDRLSDYIPCEKFSSSWVSKSLGIIPNRLWGLLLRRSKLYLVQELKREIDLQIGTLFRSESIFHFLYGENDFRRFHPQGKSKLFVTYHFPPQKYSQYFTKPPNLERVNAIIVVGSNQVDYFARWIPKEKILFIPHGIDTEYYMPADPEIRDHKILFVGTHLRDFDVLKEVIERIEKLSINLSFTIVTFKEHWKIFQGLKKIELFTDVTEARLLQYYQRHALLFLPLLDGTANNTLLEAAASGLPIITTDVGGVRDYLDDESAIFLRSRKIDTVVSTIMDILNDVRKRMELATKARQKMLSYDWKDIAETMGKVYEVY
jgi:glycosyltransferase involved in cell wall biosynthesis